MGNRDALTIHDNALRTAWGYTTQSNMDKSAASAIDPGMSAMTSLIGSAGTVSSSWNTWQKAGGTVPTWAGGKG